MKTLQQKTRATLLNFKSIAVLALVISLGAGCVTVNVNFPESAVQKASDDYVRDLYRSKEQGKSPSPKTTATPVGDSALFAPNKILDFVVPSAEAADFNMSSPKIATLTGKMKANVGDVIEQKKAGVLGETNDGHLTIKDPSKLKPLLKKKIEDVVKEDNQARDSLYAEIVSSNKLASDAVASVRKSFSRSFQAESPSGTWVQGVDGSWSQKQ